MPVDDRKTGAVWHLQALAMALLLSFCAGSQAQLRSAAARGGLSVEPRADLAEHLSTLSAALSATMARS